MSMADERSDSQSALDQDQQERAMIAHDLRHALFALVAAAERSLRHPEQVDTQAFARQVLSQSLMARAWLDDFARPERGVGHCDIAQLLEDLRGLALHPERLRIEGSSQARARASSARVTRILLNLLRNAEEASERRAEGSPIVIEVSAGAPERIAIRLRDRGDGIPQALQARLFDSGSKGDESQGQGLGLASARRLAREMGGELELESSSAEGSCFRLDLPLATGPAPKTETSELPTAAQAQHILVVDDDPNTLRAYRDILGLDGHMVETCIDAHEGLEQLIEGSFDLALIDVHLPGLPGPLFFEALCERAPERRDRIVFSTGDLTRPETRAFLENCGCPFLFKPFDLDELRALLQRMQTL